MTNKYDIYMKNIPSNVILIIYTFRKKTNYYLFKSSASLFYVCIMIIYNLFYKHTICFFRFGRSSFQYAELQKNKLVIILTFCTFS